MITNQNWANKYLLDYSLFLEFSQTSQILIGSVDVQNVVPFTKTLAIWKRNKRYKSVPLGYSFSTIVTLIYTS